jgi:Domain of unknown function (DUF4169)
MGDLVNLRAARKRAKRQQAEREAAAKRLAHGTAKAQRNLQRTRRDKASDDLEAHRIEPETER